MKDNDSQAENHKGKCEWNWHGSSPAMKVGVGNTCILWKHSKEKGNFIYKMMLIVR